MDSNINEVTTNLIKLPKQELIIYNLPPKIAQPIPHNFICKVVPKHARCRSAMTPV